MALDTNTHLCVVPCSFAKSWETLIIALKEMNSKIITSIFIPEGVDFNHMHDYFFKKNFTIYPGKVADFNTFRVANIGEIDSTDMLAFLELFKEYLNNDKK